MLRKLQNLECLEIKVKFMGSSQAKWKNKGDAVEPEWARENGSDVISKTLGSFGNLKKLKIDLIREDNEYGVDEGLIVMFRNLGKCKQLKALEVRFWCWRTMESLEPLQVLVEDMPLLEEISFGFVGLKYIGWVKVVDFWRFLRKMRKCGRNIRRLELAGEKITKEELKSDVKVEQIMKRVVMLLDECSGYDCF